MRSLLAVVGVVVLVLVVPLNAADPLKAFADDWKGVAVVLKKPLYTFGFARDAVSVLLRSYYPGQFGVTRTAPGQGVYYRYTATKPFAHTFVDTDVQRLAQRARVDAAYTGGGSSARTGQVGSMVQAPPYIEVTTFAAGTELIVKRVIYGEADACVFRIELTRPTAPTGQPVTHLVVEWPAPLSPEFVERPKVEELMADFFERVRR